MPTFPFFIADVFAEAPFEGNQLAVILGEPSDETMQALALEMNYSETTFVTTQTATSAGTWPIRIFTPATEFPFAGHPTLGTAYIIASQLLEHMPEQIILDEKVGPIPVTFAEDGVLWMQQNPPMFGQTIAAEDIAAVIGLDASAIDDRFPVQVVSTGLPTIICPLQERDALNRIRIDPSRFAALLDALKVPHLDALLAFCPQPVSPQHDFHARMLWMDELGVFEDPATGSANGNLAGWLARHRYFGTATITAQVEQGYQVRRPSLLRLRATDEGERVDVRVGGRVRLIAKGELYVD